MNRITFAIVAVITTGCGSTGVIQPDDAGKLGWFPGIPIEAGADAETTDASSDAGEASDGSSDAPIEGHAGGLLCCQTGQNILVCTGGYVDSGPASWTCGEPDGDTMAPCSQVGAVGCAVGSPCEGFNGIGTIVVCGQ